MIIGFTGTQAGLSIRQERVLTELLLQHQRYDQPLEFHHGDCVGADAQAHSIAHHLGIAIEIHPCDIAHKRAYCQGAKKIWPIKPPLARNLDIVQLSDVLFACPKGMEEELRSGTWATIRAFTRRRLWHSHIADLKIIWPMEWQGKFLEKEKGR